MESYTIKNLTFSYPDQGKKVLNQLSFSVETGQFITLVGPSGCGKTTLLRHLKTTLSPHGDMSGEIFFEGTPLRDLGQKAQTSKIGFVMQSPDNQIVTDKVWHELAFGLESLGIKTPEIRLKVAEMASFFGIQNWFYKDVTDLSGGQKQLLNLASIMAMQPSVLILDEPTSQLDPIAAAEFLSAVGKINRDLGVTVIMTEHRLEEVFPLSDRVLVLDQGRLIADGRPEDVGLNLRKMNHGMFLAMPVPMRVYAAVENKLACPVTIREGRKWLDDFAKDRPLAEVVKKDDMIIRDKPIIVLDEVWFRYEKEGPDVVKGLSMEIYPGQFYAILGGNGTGKTTALSIISGINKPYRGKTKINEDGIGLLPQNPQALFLKKTLKEDLLEVVSSLKKSKEEKEELIGQMAKLCRIENLMARHPYDLSGGEQQRAALAKILLLKPRILLLDEPTKGMDAEFKEEFANILYELLQRGVTILMVSHDLEFAAKHPHECALFFDGNIVSKDEPCGFFTSNNFYTTAANRMARHKLPAAVTAEDIIIACGGDVKPIEIKTSNDDGESKEEIWCEKTDKSKKKKVSARDVKDQPDADRRKLSKRTLLAMAMVLVAIPLTIYVGIYFLGDRKYYFISMLIILETMLPFAMIFEGRKPRARELITISVLCAMGVAGRAAFFMLPHFKPVVALVIIAGVAFGGEAGFLVGAVTAFVSNMFFGQGPWTPWQMFAFGLIGFLAGVLFRKGFLRRNTIALCIFGGLATLFIYGGIMNPAAVLTFQARPTIEMFLIAYLRGFPFDLVHATSTVVFLYFIARPMLEKLDRIKLKYGLIER